MAAKLRARAEAVKSEISATAEECVKRIVSRKQEILARVNDSVTMVLRRVILRLFVSVLENKQLIMFIGFSISKPLSSFFPLDVRNSIRDIPLN